MRGKKIVFISIMLILFVFIFSQNVYAESKPVNTKIWFITSSDYGCTTTNYNAILFLQSIGFVYFSMYGIDSKFSPPQCLYFSEFEKSPTKFVERMEDFDLSIIIVDSEEQLDYFSSNENFDHFLLNELESPRILFCYCSIPATSHTATWALSHQLSHFILKTIGEPPVVYLNGVHDIEKEAQRCIENRKYPGSCKTRWTPVFGNIVKEMMTVKIHPYYYEELNSLEQLALAKKSAEYKEFSFNYNLKWFNQVELWYNDGLISITEFENTLQFLKKFEIINKFEAKKEKLQEGNTKTVLKLNKINKINGVTPTVFSGTLLTESGHRIVNEKILIKSFEDCPANNIIAEGKTDKNGKFLITNNLLVWSNNKNIMKIYAEFLGNEQNEQSSSRQYNIVISHGNGQNCHFVEGLGLVFKKLN